MDEKEVSEMQEEMMTVLVSRADEKHPMSKASPMSWKICSRQ